MRGASSSALKEATIFPGNYRTESLREPKTTSVETTARATALRKTLFRNFGSQRDESLS